MGTIIAIKKSVLYMAITEDTTLRRVTKHYLSSYSGGKKPEEIAGDILAKTKCEFDLYNAAASAEKGIYVSDDEEFANLANEYSYGINEKDFKDLMWHLRRLAPKVKPCRESNFIAVNNGILI